MDRYTKVMFYIGDEEYFMGSRAYGANQHSGHLWPEAERFVAYGPNGVEEEISEREAREIVAGWYDGIGPRYYDSAGNWP